MDAGRVSEISWLDMQQKMVEISDVIKPEANNVHIMITFQLAKGSANQRFYTQDNIGLSKNMVDVASTCIMIRNLYDDEFPGERNELKVYRLEGKNGRSKIPVTLDRDKHYQVIFIIKNREGSTSYQIVLEHDMSRNTCKEVGVTTVERDWA
jgi:replicative DNA helicase